jgi:hypothetical protein
MGLYNFQPRFVPLILRGEKTHTIRAVRVHPDKPGDTLHLYTGLRTKKAKLLMRVPCVKIEEIEIRHVPYDGTNVLARGCKVPYIWIDGEKLSWDETQAFARRDGFRDFAEMLAFWMEPKNRLPFKGHVIHWRLA